MKKHSRAVLRPKNINARITVGFNTWWLLKKFFNDDRVLSCAPLLSLTSSIFVNNSVIIKFDLPGLLGFS